MFGHRVLVINDNKTQQALSALMCRKHGAIPVVVSRTEEALQELDRDSDFSVVLLDLGLPRAAEARASLKELISVRRKRRLHLPIVALTAHAMQMDRLECLKLGVDDYLSKPFSAQQFGDMLRKWTGTKERFRRTA